MSSRLAAVITLGACRHLSLKCAALLGVILGAGCASQVPLLRPCTLAEADPVELRAQQEVNSGLNVRWVPRRVFAPNCHPGSLARLLRWVDQTQPASVKVKAVGSRHSYSPAAATIGISVRPEGLAFLEVEGPNLVRVGSGSTLRAINETLWAMGKALPLLGGYDGQTIAGAASTGTHGSVPTQGTLADALIRQVTLVTADGQVLRVEPGAGRSRPEPGLTLVQEDERFAAAKVNLGTLGVVHDYLLEVVDRFWLEEVRTRTDLPRLEATLKAGLPRAHHLEYLWNVHTGTVIVTTREPFPEARLPSLNASERARPGAWLTDAFGRQLAAGNELLERVAPALIPSLVETALRSLEHPRYVGRSFEVYTVGDGLNAMPFELGTFSVPLEDTVRALEVIQAVTAAEAKHARYLPGPVALRFVKGLSPPAGSLLVSERDVSELELIFSGTDARSRAEADRFMDLFDRALHAELGARVSLHFGQLYPEAAATSARTSAAFPGLRRFEAIRRELDPKERFLNAFQRRLLLPP